MHKKALIISNEDFFKEKISLILMKNFDFKKILTINHEEWLKKFLEERPTHIIIGEYYEGLPSNANRSKGFQTYNALQSLEKNNNAKPTVVRCSVIKYEHEDFLFLPFQINELGEKLKIKKED